MTITIPPRDTWKLRSELDQALFDDFCLRASYRFGGEEYELGDSEIGEPFVLIRKSDGKRFEVELGAEVREMGEPCPDCQAQFCKPDCLRYSETPDGGDEL